jgi:hypothetical protein
MAACPLRCRGHRSGFAEINAAGSDVAPQECQSLSRPIALRSSVECAIYLERACSGRTSRWVATVAESSRSRAEARTSYAACAPGPRAFGRSARSSRSAASLAARRSLNLRCRRLLAGVVPLAPASSRSISSLVRCGAITGLQSARRRDDCALVLQACAGGTRRTNAAAAAGLKSGNPLSWHCRRATSSRAPAPSACLSSSQPCDR